MWPCCLTNSLERTLQYVRFIIIIIIILYYVYGLRTNISKLNMIHRSHILENLYQKWVNA